MRGPEIIICDDEAAFTTRAVALISDAAAVALISDAAAAALAADAAAAALATDAAAHGERARFRIALAGGSTPRAIYAALAHAPAIDWPRWDIFWSDERTVPPDSPESNYAMAAGALLEPLAARGVTVGRVERMRGELDPHASALAYDEMLRNLGAGAVPRFDLILLGMGADGHTASLFPHTAALGEDTRCVVANAAPHLHTVRLTFTFPLLNAARRVLFLVRGSDKAATLRTVLEGPRDVAAFPSQGVRPAQGTVTWLLDAAAAALL